VFTYFYSLGYDLWSVEELPIGSHSSLLRASFATRKEMT